MRRSVSATALFAIVLWAGTQLSGGLRAQETGVEPRTVTRGTLTDDTLSQMLDDMGLEPKKLKQGYVVSIKQGEWTYNVQVLISANKEKIGLNANMGTVEDPASVTASQWMNLLASNTDTAPSFFYYNKANKMLYLHRVLDNRAVTSTILRQQIDAFCGNIKDTADLWKFTK